MGLRVTSELNVKMQRGTGAPQSPLQDLLTRIDCKSCRLHRETCHVVRPASCGARLRYRQVAHLLVIETETRNARPLNPALPVGGSRKPYGQKIPAVQRSRKASRCGRRALAGIHRWTEDGLAGGRDMEGSPMASGRSKLRVAVRALVKARERTRRRRRRRTLSAPQ